MICIRKHTLTSGDALDRRRIVELFMEAAKRFTSVHRDAIRNKQFGREHFDLDAWEEYQSNYQLNIKYVVPKHGHQAPGSGLVVLNDDSYFEANVSWSALIKVNSTASFRVLGWPVTDGQGLWSAESWAEVDQLFKYDNIFPSPEWDETIVNTAFTNDGYLTLGGSCNVQGINGRSYFGVLFASIGKFSVESLQVNLRKRI
jgi:hypothetical protein